jgi:predicted TIM-barrel enzyme
MADLTGDSVAANFEQINKGVNGLGGRTQIVSVNKGTGDHTEAELVALTKALSVGTTADPDTFTVAGIAGTVGTDPVYLALQGTGTVGVGAGDYVADITLAVVADFDQSTEGQA